MLRNESGGGGAGAPFRNNKKVSVYLNANSKVNTSIAYKNKKAELTRNNKD